MAPKCNSFVIEDFGIECRQYLRGFYNKDLEVRIDYERELDSQQDPTAEKVTRTYASFFNNGTNICFEMIKRGLCKVIKHKMADKNRAIDYQQYTEIEEEAIKNKAGIYGVSKLQ